jgi:hypothetical protein
VPNGTFSINKFTSLQHFDAVALKKVAICTIISEKALPLHRFCTL